MEKNESGMVNKWGNSEPEKERKQDEIERKQGIRKYTSLPRVDEKPIRVRCLFGFALNK